MATVDWDSGYLSAYLDVPRTTIDTLIDAPTVDLVRSLLDAVALKAREYEELQADRLRLDVEFENTVRNAESRHQGLKTTVDKALKDVNDLREKLTSEENTRSSLENELQQLKSSSSTSSSEVDSLRVRIASLEAANRDTVAVLESKSTANDALAQDLQKQHQKGLELNQQIAALQQSVQTANSAASSAKFREQSLNQELEQVRRNNEWLDSELKTKSAEALKFRKEKGARIAELQRLNEEVSANLDALKRTELALRSRLDEVQKKAEESLAKVQQLQEAAATREEGYRQELESSHRLAELQSQQAETHRNRLKEVEASLERARDDAVVQIRRARQEAEGEREEREKLENRIVELEAEIDRLEATASVQPHPVSVPGTPRQGLNGSMFGRSGSPAQFGTPGSVRSKSAITATQAIDELYKVKGQLATERRRNERLVAEMEEMVQGLEAKQPEIEELQAEHERLQQEMVEMSKFVDQTGKQRDRAKKDARKAESEASTAQAEANILRQQMRDLSAQIKMLLCDLDARERGLDALSASERSQLERLARGEVSEDAFEGLTDTDRFISQRLTVFRSISELQEKNQELLKITRQLGAQMESEEALTAKHQAAQDHEQVQALEKKIESYKDELQSMIVRSESYMKERDMFRRMLQHRGQLPQSSDLASVFGQSVDGNGVIATIEQSPNGKDNANNYAALLRELQSHFDQYREEQATDRRTMKEQTEKLSSEKGALQSDIARISSQLTLANERYEMLHANYTMLQNENKELQKRSQILSEAAAKQDLRTQQVAEDLIEAKGSVESMRNEISNLKAEKKLWKEIQDRLSQDNESLMSERSRLNSLIANQQSLLNERELSESETRRRLQIKIESLENELSATKRKLADEIEDSKKTQLRKEYESQQNQKRIDDLVTSLSLIREELVAAKTTRDHLHARVDELAIELKSAEERVQVLQPRHTPRPGTQNNGDVHQISEEESLRMEQELAIEVSELRRDLDLSKSELENAKAQMEQYKAISQASEEELRSFNDTQDQYRQDMDHIIEEKDSKIRELQQQVEDLSAELSSINYELNISRNQQAEIARRASEEKAALDAEITRLRDDDERHATTAQFHQQDLRAQANIANKAQQDYEHELVKHADAAKLLQNLRADYNALKTESASLRAEAESAKVALSQTQSSWEERREQFEKELNELRTRRDEIGAQNRLLLQQLEAVSAQVSGLQQKRATYTENGEPETSVSESTSDRSLDGLRELMTYLRRDKEIVDVQYELSIQEAKRLKQQLDYVQSQLDESRLKLDQERRAQADGTRTTLAHKDLMEKLNELNLFRESSITLRNEARQAQAQLAEKTKKVEELLESIQPLELKVRELENAKEMQEGELLLLQEDRDRWQKRNQEILSKYDRIDPAEMEQLKESLAILQAEHDTLISDQEPLREKVQTLETEKATWQQSRQKLIEQAKERSRVLTKDKNEKLAERDAAIQEKEVLEQQLSTMRQELETFIQEKLAVEQQLFSMQQELENSIQEKQTFEKQLVALQQELSSSKSSMQPSVSDVEQPRANPVATPVEPLTQENRVVGQELSAIRQELEMALKEKNELEQQRSAIQQELITIRSERDEALASLAAFQKITNSAKAADVVMSNGVEEGQVYESTTSLTDAERKTLEDKLSAAEAKVKEEESKLKELQDNMDNTIKQRSEKMKTLLNNKLSESRAAAKAALEEEYKTRLEQDKQIWLAEHASSSASTVHSKEALSTTAPIQEVASPNGRSSSSLAPDVMNMSDGQLRELLATNATAKSILGSNLKKKLEAETQKLKEEYEKVMAQKLAEAAKKAEEMKAQAVLMEGKKSELKLNMAGNKMKLANAKIEVVEKAANETPEKPVGEVWEIAKNAKPPPTVAANTVTVTQGASAPPEVGKLAVKSEPGATQIPQPPTVNNAKPQEAPASAIPQAPGKPANAGQAPNGTSSLPLSKLPAPPTQPANNNHSGIPRGGGNMRGRGTYLPPRGGSNPRGRGGGVQRGGATLNPGAQPYSPGAGNKHPRDESQNGPAQQGNGQKRIRGGGGGT